MRALIATVGSEGDLRPFYALAKELLARDHEVLFTAPDFYGKTVEGLGIAFRKVGLPWTPEHGREVSEKILEKSNPATQLEALIDMLEEAERQMVPEYLELVQHFDVVIYPPIMVAAVAAARAKGVKHVSVQVAAPPHRAKSYSPSGTNLGPVLNSIAWKIGKGVIGRATDRSLNTIVGAAGLSPWKDVLVKSASSSWLDLVAVSSHVIPPDPAWPSSSRATGYWVLSEPNVKVDPALEAFVGTDKPVVIGFGSMNGFDQKATTQTILAAARDLDRKVIVQSGWAGLGEGEMPSNVFVTRFVPHEWLFARASCVVHHGGAGTTAAAIRAGVPQMIVWHLADQPFWGNRVKGLGIGPTPIFYRKMTDKTLGTGIRKMLSDEPMKERARVLGERVRSEKSGVATSVSMIEEALRSDQ